MYASTVKPRLIEVLRNRSLLMAKFGGKIEVLGATNCLILPLVAELHSLPKVLFVASQLPVEVLDGQVGFR